MFWRGFLRFSAFVVMFPLGATLTVGLSVTSAGLLVPILSCVRGTLRQRCDATDRPQQGC